MPGGNRSFRLKVVIAFGLVYVFWGSTYLGIGIVVQYMSALVMGAVRFSIAGAALLLWCALRGRRVRLRMHEFLRLTFLGVVLLSIGNVLLGSAETYIPTGLASLMIAITPLWFLLLERLSSRGERIGRRGLAGILLGICGMVVLMWPALRAGLHLGRREFIGAGLVLLSSISWACGSIVSKRWHLQVDAYSASGWQMMMAGLVNCFVGLLLGSFKAASWTRPGLLAIGYLIIAGSWVGFTAYVWLLHHVSTTKLATYAYVNPIVAVFLGWLVLHERITPYIVAGSVIVMVSVILITGAKHVPPSTAPEPEPIEALAGAEVASD
jgi:drug/metabolite transporter (DMT)-like permease